VVRVVLQVVVFWLYVLMLIVAGFLLFVGVLFLASSGDSWFGGDFFALGLLSMLVGGALAWVSIVRLRRRWRAARQAADDGHGVEPPPLEGEARQA
jgi:hypothetical protein